MRVLRVAAVMALMVGPAYAQMPKLNLLQDGPDKTQDQKDADEAREKAYQDTLRKIPDAKTSSDPWGGVRNDTPTKTSTAKTPASKKTAKTGSNPN